MAEQDRHLTYEDLDRETYEAFARPFSNLLQSWDWADVKNNWDSQHMGLRENGELVAAALILKKQLPMGYSAWYLPRGPLARSTSDLTAMVNRIGEAAKKEKCVFIKFDPYVTDREWYFADGQPEAHNSQDLEQILYETSAQHKGYTMDMGETAQPRVTMGIDLTRDFRDHYLRIAKRQIRKAETLGVQAEQYTWEQILQTPEIMDEFVRLMKCTESEKNIQLRAREYYERMMKTYPGAVIYLARLDTRKALENISQTIENTPDTKKNKGKLESLAKQKEQIHEMIEQGYKDEYISGMLVIHYGTVSNLLYMGNDRTYEKCGAANYLYDYVYEDCKNRGSEYADMSGVEATFDDGLTRHKASYGSKVKEYVGEFDLPVNGMLYKMLGAAEKMLGR